MPFRRATVLAVALLAVGVWARGGAAAEHRVALRYDVYYGPVRFLAIESRSRMDEASYWTELRMRTVGVIGSMFSWSSRSESAGLLHGAELDPQQHRVDAVWRRQRRTVTMSWDGNGEPHVEAEPSPAAEGLPAIPLEQRRETMDPGTATLAMIRDVVGGAGCRGVQRVFDGRHRYDVRLEDRGAGRLERANGSLYEGVAHRCDAAVQPVAGFKPDDLRTGAVRLSYWLARVVPDIDAVPARIDVSGQRGTVHAYLVEARVPDARELDADGAG